MPAGHHTVLLVGAGADPRDLLVQQGYRVLLASTSVQARAMMVRDMPRLVVIDLAGIEQDGPGLLAWLKTTPVSVGIPVILLATTDRRDERLTGLAAGADEVLAHPLDGDELCLRVRNLLRLSTASPQGLSGVAQQVAIL
ncbi:MAG: response regulator transcription factor, partial [Oxalobacteraceae bacterium]|nr:response regulator transcription factor [Oxalobacteraceae bacterium]